MTLPRPQRLFHSSPPGSLLKSADRGATAPAQDASEVSGAAYLSLVRSCPCLKCGLDPCGLAAHLRMNSAAYNKRQAMQKKPQPKWTTPLCAACHTEDRDAQHKAGEAAFWMRLGINPFLVCEQLYAQRTDLVAMRAVIFSTISQRGK